MDRRVWYLGELWYLETSTWKTVESLQKKNPDYKTKITRTIKQVTEELWVKVSLLTQY